MLISCKYEEIYSPEVFDFVYITENTYEKSDIIRLEKEILSMISFKMTVPTANAFYEIISESLAFDKKEYYLGRYLMEILLLDYRSLKYKPSEIAHTVCFIIFIHKRNNDIIYFSDLANEFIYNYRNNGMNYKDCARNISFLLDNIQNTQLLSVRNKYLTPVCYRVALIKRIFNIEGRVQ